jgi:flagellar hook-associated protein 1 FlgK
MPNLLSGINVALRALLSHQQAIEVIEHNVANANTPGYRRQEAVLTSGIPYPSPGLHSSGGWRGQMGTGVNVNRIRRFNLEFYDGRYRQEVAEYKRWEQQSEVLRQAEISLAETGSDSLISKLDAFWSGWQALSSDPTNQVLRNDLVERSVALSQAINQRAKSLAALRKDQDLAINQRTEEINTLATQVSRLNVEITNVLAAGGQPNDHLDERDRLLDRLAEIGGAVSSQQENGEVLVSLEGHALVVGSKTFQLSTVADPGNDNLLKISWAGDGLPFNPKRGELAGLLEARDDILRDQQLGGLNNLAFALADQVNTLHRTGYSLNGKTADTPPGYDGNFFEAFSTQGNYALEIQVDQDILADSANIAAAAANAAPGDGRRATDIFNLQYQIVLNNSTLNGYYTGKIGELGLKIQGATTNARDRKVVSDSLASMAESVGGVSLDEEAANLVKAQRVYQAAARLMTAMDEMLDKVINGMGVVGR